MISRKRLLVVPLLSLFLLGCGKMELKTEPASRQVVKEQLKAPAPKGQTPLKKGGC